MNRVRSSSILFELGMKNYLASNTCSSLISLLIKTISNQNSYRSKYRLVHAWFGNLASFKICSNLICLGNEYILIELFNEPNLNQAQVAYFV